LRANRRSSSGSTIAWGMVHLTNPCRVKGRPPPHQGGLPRIFWSRARRHEHNLRGVLVRPAVLIVPGIGFLFLFLSIMWHVHAVVDDARDLRGGTTGEHPDNPGRSPDPTCRPPLAALSGGRSGCRGFAWPIVRKRGARVNCGSRSCVSAHVREPVPRLGRSGGFWRPVMMF